MTYQVLARKWRPQEFGALVGQEPIVQALRNALLERRIAQAYLFSGIRGVGKTTAARLLAKALNCEQGPTPEPCNQCRPCREITSGSDLDVIEVDAATYSKVEQVRELTESLRYGPSADRYKVVVLDEVHRLSRQAFDALLKIVEEPPAHLTFIFATTEAEAVPATLLSRCQEFHFRRVPAEPLAAHLRTIAESEQIEASDTALRLVARAGEGSVRDAVALLDQLATFGGGKVADTDAVRLLGGLDTSLFQRLLEAILAGERAEVATLVRQVEDHGWDPRSVFAQFLAYLRDALHVALGADTDRVDLPSEEIDQLRALLGGVRYEDLLRLLHLLLGTEETVRRSEAGYLALEIAWLRAAELPKLRRVEEILGAREEPGRGPEHERLPQPQRSGGTGGAPRARSERAAAAVQRAAPESTPESVAAVSPRADLASGERQEVGRSTIIEEVALRRQPLAAHLEAVESMEYVDGTLRIVVPAGDELLSEALTRDGNRVVLDAVVEELWGPGARWATQEGQARSAPAPLRGDIVASSNDLASPAADEALSHPTVQTVLDLFGGTVEAVERRPTEE